MKGLTAAAVVAVLAALAGAACTSTPDLAYIADNGDGGGSSGASSSGASSSGTSSSGASSSGASSSGASSSGASSSGASSSGDGSTGDGSSGNDAPSDSSGDAALLCPLVVQTGVDCCAAPAPGARTCVREACAHCSDCLAAGCTPTQYCCPTFAPPPPPNKYKGVVCKDTPAC